MKANLLALVVALVTVLPALARDDADLERFQKLLRGQWSGSAERIVQEAELRVEQAKEIRDAPGVAVALTELGLVHVNNLHDYEIAMDLFIKALVLEDSMQLDAEKVLTYISIARVFELVGDHYKSAHFLELSLKLNAEHRNINTMALILNNLGRINAMRGKTDEAFNHYQQVLQLREDISESFQAEALYNLGDLSGMQGDHAKALEHHKRSLAIARRLRDAHAEARSLNAIGGIYNAMSHLKRSMANHEVSLAIRKRLNDNRGIAESCSDLGALYLQQGDFNQAIAYGRIALSHAGEAQDREQIYRSSDLLSQAYQSTGDFENALKYREASHAIHDLVQRESQEGRLLEAENRYIVEKKESEIDNLERLRIEREKEIAAQKRFRNILFLIVALVLVIAGLLLILYLVKRRANVALKVAKKEVQMQNGMLQELNHTKDKFFSIISHDLKGPLNSLTSFAHLLISHTDHLSKEEIRTLATDLDKSVKNLLALLENLLEWSRSQTGNIDFTPEVFDLHELLQQNKTLLSPQAAQKNITIFVEDLDQRPVRLHRASINTVVRNLMSNAIKFTNPGGQVSVAFRSKDNSVSLCIADNGVGMSQEVVDNLFRLDNKHSTRGTAQEKGTGLGLILCREFVEKNGGVIRASSEPGKGSVFTLEFSHTVLVPELSKVGS